MASNFASDNDYDDYVESYVATLKKLQEEFFYVDPNVVEDEFYRTKFNYPLVRSVLAYNHRDKDPAPRPNIRPRLKEKENYDKFSVFAVNPQLYRNEAQVHYAERRKSVDLSHEAAQKGLMSTATKYEHLGNMHLKKFEEANQRAGKRILMDVNVGSDENTLDLHLLHVDEALREAKKFLSKRLEAHRRMDLQVTIITGRGIHSARGESRLKPAIRTFLQRADYKFVECNGSFRITLQSPSR